MKSLPSIFFSVLLLGTLTGTLSSCSEKEDRSVSDAKITFANPVISPSTRVSSVNPIFPENQSFKVFAQWDKEEFKSWGGTGSVLYMDNVETKYDATKMGWVPIETYLWPKQGKLTFAAYAPASVTGTYGKEGLQIADFTVPAEGNVDLLYSRRSYNRNSSITLGNLSSPYQGVDIVFQHALCQIQFTIKTIAQNETKQLESLTLRNVHSKGQFNERVIEDSDGPFDVYRTDDSRYRKWHLTGTANSSYTIIQNMEVTSVKKTSASFILMPQRFSPGPGPQGNTIDSEFAELIFKWEGVPEADVIKLSDIILVWEPGKSYTYNITVGSSMINFKPAIPGDWIDQGGIDIKP